MIRTISKGFGWLFLSAFTLLAISWIITAPNSDERGFWKTDGYGFYFDIGRLKVDAYEYSDVHCYRTMRFPGHLWLVNMAEGIQFSAQDNVLTVQSSETVNPITARRIPELPAMCDPETPTRPAGPEETYQVFWHSLNDHYSYFDLHGVDWQAQYDTFRPQVTATTNNDELFDIMMASIADLDDGHTYLEDPVADKDESPAKAPAWTEGANGDQFREVVNSYAISPLTHVSNTGITYGWLAPEIGVIILRHMDAKVGFGKDRRAVAAKKMQVAVTALKDAKEIIIDLRFNPGGDDSSSLGYASRFTDKQVLAFTKATRTGTGYTQTHPGYVEPSDATPYLKPVTLLTSGVSASAAEIFTMAMREMPHVTVAGERTSGGLSDIMSRELPNGWELGLSHQRYYAPDGQEFELVGVPPDIAVEFDRTGFDNGQDSLLEWAIAIANDHIKSGD